MALVVITVQDTENGAVVSLASEPLMNMSALPAGKAQELAHLMLGALPMNTPQEAAAAPAAQEEGTSADADADVQFPM
jgi:hypothetical protein